LPTWWADEGGYYGGAQAPMVALLDPEDAVSAIENLPSAQPEPAIPLSWIEGQIGWLKGLDNAFSTLTAGQILAMMNKWKDEQNGDFGCL